MRYIKFYGENDLTLGQFIEISINEYIVQYLDPKALCAGKGCEQPLFRHGKVFTHNETKIFVAVEKWEGHIVGLTGFYPAPELVTTWSACRVCGSATPFIPVSEEMQRYSFAKFLELHFYPAEVLLVQGAGCQHNIYQHHVRYFAFKGMTLRFQTESVQCHELVFPPFRIRVRPEAQLEIKNTEFERLFYHNLLWYTGLIDDLKLISIEAATGDEDADALLLADINALITRAESEREDISRLVNKIYRESAPTDSLALNQVHAYRQDKIVGWQQDFDRLPKPRPLQLSTNRDSKRTSAFGSVRQMWPRRYDYTLDTPHLPSANVSEAEETNVKAGRIVTGDFLTSSASETSEPETVPEKGVKETNEENLPEHSASSVKAGTPETTTSEDQPRSDPDSDSTIGAVREDVLREEAAASEVNRFSFHKIRG
jgi:1-phosphatidylinositol-3-phosphate 5-kinase